MTSSPASPTARPGFDELPALFETLAEAFATGRPATWTDRYKFLMSEAGFPLRYEWFVFSCRRGGPYYNPLRISNWIQNLLPRYPTDEEFEYLAADGLQMGQGFRDAMKADVQVHALPKGAWFNDKEPVFLVGGPSALVSNMEGSIIGETTFRINVATILKQRALGIIDQDEVVRRLGVATCKQEADIILSLAHRMNVTLKCVAVDMEGYYNHVYDRCKAILDVVDGDASRVSEGGLRSATCPQNHLIAVAAARAAGWKATSNVFLAKLFGMKPVGTTGHEHTQRLGSDLSAYEAAIGRCPGNVTMLLDTFSTLLSGLPTALKLMERLPDRPLSVRPDCEPTMEGDVHAILSAFKSRGLAHAGLGLSGGFNVEKTERFEAIRKFHEWPPELVNYLYGEFTLKPHVPLPTRSSASAVFKVCNTGGRPTMKFSDGKDGKPGPKSSKPNMPVIFRLSSPEGVAYTQHPMGIIGQLGESPPPGYELLTEEGNTFRDGTNQTIYKHFTRYPSPDSPATAALVARLTAERGELIRSALD